MSTRRASTVAAEARRIRAERPPKPSHDPWKPLGVQVERERAADGRIVDAATIFLTGRECPFTCVFCDLWRYTLDQVTPDGAIPAQIQEALTRLRRERGAEGLSRLRLKLYNASNFFDAKAVPPRDDERLLELLRPFPRVVVECHPKLVGRRCFAFAERLGGRLEVALGLETVHPEAQPRLGKQASLDEFERAFRALTEAGIAVRAFVLVGAPFVPAGEAVEWAAASVRWAFERGAETVALIPVRGGEEGKLRRLREAGELTPPTLRQLESALEESLRVAAQLGQGAKLDGRVAQADLWDVELLVRCPECAAVRIARLERLNLEGPAALEATRPFTCASCGEGVP